MSHTFERISEGVTYKSKTESHTFYTTINHNEDNKVFEIFVRINDKELFEMIQLVTRSTSQLLQLGKDPLEIAKELQETFSPVTMHMIPKTNIMCPSIVARIGLLLEQRILAIQNMRKV